jgi:UDP-N-acetylglucosamine 2-epimerase (non-hydrolysing)
VEAGLRSGDKKAPFPEEVLRRLTDVIADVHFAPTRQARDLLVAEHAPADALRGGGRAGPARIHVTGNTVVDALHKVAAQDRPVANDVLRGRIHDPQRRLVLLTAHRRESFGEPIREVFRAVRRLVDEVPDIEVLYPVHPNPNVREPAEAMLGDHPRVHLTEPLDYFDLVAALRRASLVLTDSGGIQEEAPTFGAPVLVLREVTERPEGVEAGVAELVGTDATLIVSRAVAALERGSGTPRPNPYGDGLAGARIADIVVSALTGRPRTTEDWEG